MGINRFIIRIGSASGREWFYDNVYSRQEFWLRHGLQSILRQNRSCQTFPAPLKLELKPS